MAKFKVGDVVVAIRNINKVQLGIEHEDDFPVHAGDWGVVSNAIEANEDPNNIMVEWDRTSEPWYVPEKDLLAVTEKVPDTSEHAYVEVKTSIGTIYVPLRTPTTGNKHLQPIVNVYARMQRGESKANIIHWIIIGEVSLTSEEQRRFIDQDDYYIAHAKASQRLIEFLSVATGIGWFKDPTSDMNLIVSWGDLDFMDCGNAILTAEIDDILDKHGSEPDYIWLYM